MNVDYRFRFIIWLINRQTTKDLEPRENPFSNFAADLDAQLSTIEIYRHLHDDEENDAARLKKPPLHA